MVTNRGRVACMQKEEHAQRCMYDPERVIPSIQRDLLNYIQSQIFESIQDTLL